MDKQPSGLAVLSRLRKPPGSTVRIHPQPPYQSSWLNTGYHSLFNRNNLNVGTSLLLREGGETQIRLHYPDVGEDLLSVLSLEAGVDNDIVTYYKVRECPRRKSVEEELTGNPVDRGGDSVLVTSLKRVDNAEDFSGVATSGSGV
jgi:hypothetical protein